MPPPLLMHQQPMRRLRPQPLTRPRANAITSCSVTVPRRQSRRFRPHFQGVRNPAQKNFDALVQLAKDKKIKTEGMILVQKDHDAKVTGSRK